jgi:DNA-binding transcriptional LysR family regulator
MDLRQLRHFAVLARELHYRRAAEALGTAQPTLSQQILALERDLGVQLFDRSKRSVRLTNAGRVFLDEVHAILEQVDIATDHAREAQAGRRGLLRVGTTSLTLSAHLPRVARAFRAMYPQITLKMSVMHSNELLEELKRRRIQIAFGRADMQAEAIASEVLWEFPYRLILPAGHPEARKAAVHLNKLRDETLIIYPRSLIGESYDEFIAFCRAHGFTPKSVEEVAGVDAIVGLVAAGLGVAILPSDRMFGVPDTVSKPIAASGNWRFATAAYWRTDESSPLVRVFFETARASGHRRAVS